MIDEPEVIGDFRWLRALDRAVEAHWSERGSRIKPVLWRICQAELEQKIPSAQVVTAGLQCIILAQAAADPDPRWPQRAVDGQSGLLRDHYVSQQRH